MENEVMESWVWEIIFAARKHFPDHEIVKVYRAFEGDFRVILRNDREETRWSVSEKLTPDFKILVIFTKM